MCRMRFGSQGVILGNDNFQCHLKGFKVTIETKWKHVLGGLERFCMAYKKHYLEKT